MENKASKKIKLLTFVILLLVVVPSGIDFAKGFYQGMKSYAQEAELTNENAMDYHSFFVQLEQKGEKAKLEEVGNGHLFQPVRESGALVVAEKSGSAWWILILNALLAQTGIIALGFFVVLLFRFAAKLSKRRLMAEENIRALQQMAYALGIFSLSAYLMESLGVFWLRSHIVLDGYKIILDTPPASLIVALIILVMTEMLKLGHKLQQEQDLTI